MIYDHTVHLRMLLHHFTIHTSPQYSLINSFFAAPSLIKIPQPATSDGAKSRCYGQQQNTM